MRRRSLSLVPCFILLAACSAPSGGGAGNASGDEAGPSEQAAEGGGAGTVTEHGVVYDYGTVLANGSLRPVKGLTVTDGDQTTTTAADGTWSLTLPIGSTLNGSITGTSEGDPYSTLSLVSAVANGPDFDHGNIIIPDTSTFQLEQETVTAQATQALVHVLVVATGNCASAAGGTLTVTSPPGAQVMYFASNAYPSSSQTSFADVPAGRPVADIFDLAPGAPVTVQVSHPTCTQAPYPAAFGGGNLTGTLSTQACEPGDHNAALIVVLE